MLSNPIKDRKFYTIGVWTPNFSGNGSPANFSSVGNYTKIGRRVFVSGFFSWDKGTLSGAQSIAGLPYPPSTIPNMYQSIAVGLFSGITLPAQRQLTAHVLGSLGSKIFFYLSGATANQMADTDMGATNNFIGFGGSYDTD